MKLTDITAFLEQIAPLRFQENYDNSGLLLGDPGMDISGALICLDATEEVINEAKDLNCNLVIAHHPILFSGIKRFKHDNYVDRALITAIKNDIAIYAIHTNLDNVLRHGVNEKIAQRLQLSNVEVLSPHASAHLETSYQIGAGAIGTLENSMTGKEFLAYVKDRMNLNVLRHTRILHDQIKRVSVCGGSGSFLLPAAINASADVFVTADFKYHQFFDANDRLMIVDIGHYESEYFTIELLYELISKKFPKFAAHYTKVITNPVFYY